MSDDTLTRLAPPASRLETDFAADVRRDLALAPKQLQSKYLYDALGSSLFEAICRLPWYRITRAERALLNRHALEIVARLQAPRLSSGQGRLRSPALSSSRAPSGRSSAPRLRCR